MCGINNALKAFFFKESFHFDSVHTPGFNPNACQFIQQHFSVFRGNASGERHTVFEQCCKLPALGSAGKNTNFMFHNGILSVLPFFRLFLV